MTPYRCRMSWMAGQILLAALVSLEAAGPESAFAQDLKPLSSALASRISGSGRKTVAVVDFTDIEGRVANLGRFLAEEVSVDLLEATKGFEVIDRTHLKVILQEHRLSATGLIDPQTARKLGQVAGADALVTGTITPLGDTIRVSVKVLDTESAKMIAASSTDIPNTPAVVALMNQAGTADRVNDSPTVSEAGQNASHPLPVVMTMQANNLEFGVRWCRLSGTLLSCVGFVRNKADRRRKVAFHGTYVVDDRGNQYFLGDKFAFGAHGTAQDLEPDLPLNVSFSVENFSPAAMRATIIFSGHVENEETFSVPMRNIVIEKK